MNRPSQSLQTKEKILQAAQAEFMQKGFEHTRMQDIARRAGVTKMMLYYHFNNKENILKELLQDIFRQVKDVIPDEIAGLINNKKLDAEFFKMQIKKLIEPHMEIINFVAKEFIKDSYVRRFAYNMLQGFYDQMLELLTGRGVKIKNKEQYYIRMFFFHTVPLLMYFLFKEEFWQTIDCDVDMMDKVFFKKFIDTMYDTIVKPPLK